MTSRLRQDSADSSFSGWAKSSRRPANWLQACTQHVTVILFICTGTNLGWILFVMYFLEVLSKFLQIWYKHLSHRPENKLIRDWRPGWKHGTWLSFYCKTAGFLRDIWNSSLERWPHLVHFLSRQPNTTIIMLSSWLRRGHYPWLIVSSVRFSMQICFQSDGIMNAEKYHRFRQFLQHRWLKFSPNLGGKTFIYRSPAVDNFWRPASSSALHLSSLQF